MLDWLSSEFWVVSVFTPSAPGLGLQMSTAMLGFCRTLEILTQTFTLVLQTLSRRLPNHMESILSHMYVITGL